MQYLFAPPSVTSVPIVGNPTRFPVHRIYCVGRNYEDHAQEMGQTGREPPFFFMKPADAVVVAETGLVTPLPYPSLTHNLHHEVELVLAIGVGGKDIPVAQAPHHVFGYAIGLDMTRRDLQNDMKKQGRPWCIGKAFDHSAPMGAITPKAQAGNIDEAVISLQVNGGVRQNSSISKLIWNLSETIAQLSCAWTLQPGDLIFTGTPAGVAAVKPGDSLMASISGLGHIELIVT